MEVPVRLKIHRPVTEGYCVVATQGGELPEVNCQSVTKLMRKQRRATRPSDISMPQRRAAEKQKKNREDVSMLWFGIALVIVRRSFLWIRGDNSPTRHKVRILYFLSG